MRALLHRNECNQGYKHSRSKLCVSLMKRVHKVLHSTHILWCHCSKVCKTYYPFWHAAMGNGFTGEKITCFYLFLCWSVSHQCLYYSPALLFRSEPSFLEMESGFGIQRSTFCTTSRIICTSYCPNKNHFNRTQGLFFPYNIDVPWGRVCQFLKKLTGYLHWVTDGSLSLSPLELTHCQTG